MRGHRLDHYDLRWDDLADIAEALGYQHYSDYNKACIHRPREVLDRLYELAEVQ